MLDRDCCVRRERLEDVEVGGRELRRVGIVDVEHANHDVLVPERRAHERSDVAVLHAACGRVPCLDRGVGGQHRDTIVNDFAHDRSTQRWLLHRGAVAAPCHVRRQLAGRLVDQEQEGTLDGDGVEHDRHDPLQDFRKRSPADQLT